MHHLGLTPRIKWLSFLRRWESSFFIWLDSHLRGNDRFFGAWLKENLTVGFAVLLALAPVQVFARSHPQHHSAPQVITGSELPPEARTALHLIKQGGPFPYSRDGVVFGNREHKLPQQPRGYYHEYTVQTPGAHDRGARRIVCGPLPECYYSSDHYRTFSYIRE